MKTILFPAKSDWKTLLARPAADTAALEIPVANILKEVRENGDAALRKFALAFDKSVPGRLQVSADEIKTAETLVPAELKAAIIQAKKNIEYFHRSQLEEQRVVETMPGVRCWRRSVAIDKVGLYIPGGSAPLFSTVLMLGVPASIAGCHEIILCSPPDAGGGLHPAIVYSASLVGIQRIYITGGAQAVAAMAYGTETIPQVNKIFGPGNRYVTLAKQLLQREGVAIDIPAGPSEVAVYAGASANPDFVAADLLSQAEHGADSEVLLVTLSETVVKKVLAAVDRQLEKLERKKIAGEALQHSKAIVVENETEAMELLNAYAPEHLILCCDNAESLAGKVINAGSVFLGHYSPESVGDYASGTNHTLPTNGYARAYSGVSVDSFIKKITFQQLSKEGLMHIGKTVVAMAEAEQLQAHAAAVTIRMQEK